MLKVLKIWGGGGWSSSPTATRRVPGSRGARERGDLRLKGRAKRCHAEELWRSGPRVASVRGHGEHLVRHAGLRNGGRRMPWQERSVRPGRRGGGGAVPPPRRRGPAAAPCAASTASGARRATRGGRDRRAGPGHHHRRPAPSTGCRGPIPRPAPAARPARPRTRSPCPTARTVTGGGPPSAAGGSASRGPGARRPGRPSGRPSRATAGPPPVWTTRPTCPRCPRTPGTPLSTRHSPRGLRACVERG